MRILLNGIPASGKTTYATRLHLALEHLGFETVLLDDEVIKRLDTKKIDTLIDFIDAPITIIASCNPDIQADITFWIECSVEEAERRDNDRLKKEGLVGGDMRKWENYQSRGMKVDNWNKIVCVLKTKNLNF